MKGQTYLVQAARHTLISNLHTHPKAMTRQLTETDIELLTTLSAEFTRQLPPTP